MNKITNKEIEIMRDIKAYNPIEFIELIEIMKELKVSEYEKKIEHIDPIYLEIKYKKKQIIKKILHSDSVRDIRIINSFYNGMLSTKKETI